MMSITRKCLFLFCFYSSLLPIEIHFDIPGKQLLVLGYCASAGLIALNSYRHNQIINKNIDDKKTVRKWMKGNNCVSKDGNILGGVYYRVAYSGQDGDEGGAAEAICEKFQEYYGCVPYGYHYYLSYLWVGLHRTRKTRDQINNDFTGFFGPLAERGGKRRSNEEERKKFKDKGQEVAHIFFDAAQKRSYKIPIILLLCGTLLYKFLPQDCF